MTEPIRWERVADTAERLKVSEQLIRAAVKAGDLQAYPVGRREYRLDPLEADAWMKSRAWEPRVSA